MAGRIFFALSVFLFSLLQNLEFVQCQEHKKGDTSRVILSLKVSKVFTTNSHCTPTNRNHTCDYAVRICLATRKREKSDKCVYSSYRTSGYDFIWEGLINSTKWNNKNAYGTYFEQTFNNSHRMTELTHPEKKLPTIFTIKDTDYKPDRIYSLKVVLYKVQMDGKLEYERTKAAELFRLLHHDELMPNGDPMKVLVQDEDRSEDRNPRLPFIFGAHLEVWLECMHGYYGCSCDIQCLADDKFSCRSDGARHCHKDYYPEGICGRHCITRREDSYICGPDGEHICQKGYLTKWNYEGNIHCDKKLCLPDKNNGNMTQCMKDKNNLGHCCETPLEEPKKDGFYQCVKNEDFCFKNFIKKKNNAFTTEMLEKVSMA